MPRILTAPNRNAARPPERGIRRYFQLGVVGSLVIHLLLFEFVGHRTPRPPLETFAVEFVPAAEPRRPTEPPIVAPPDSRPSEAAPTAYRSDTDNVVVREQIKRGDAPDAGATRAEPPAPEPRRSAATTKPAPAPRRAETTPPKAPAGPLKHLALDTSTVLREFSKPTEAKETNDPLAPPTEQYRAFSRPRGSGAAIVGLRGSNDYLPNLPDGDLTLLNTKANRFAVFVRRVATQVFGQLRRSGWEYLQPGDISRINDHATVVATLSPKGELIEVKLLSPSGSARFDEVVVAAVKKGAQDPHPPPGAESADGTIRFIFKSKSWVQLGGDPRGPAFGERRWILLGTGLE